MSTQEQLVTALALAQCVMEAGIESEDEALRLIADAAADLAAEEDPDKRCEHIIDVAGHALAALWVLYPEGVGTVDELQTLLDVKRSQR